METTKKIKRVNKDEPTGFDRFNRVSKGANAVLNIIFIIMSLLCSNTDPAGCCNFLFCGGFHHRIRISLHPQDLLS